MAPQQEFFTIADAAKYVGLTSDALRARIKKKEVEVERIGSRIFMTRAALDDLFRSKLCTK